MTSCTQRGTTTGADRRRRRRRVVLGGRRAAARRRLDASRIGHALVSRPCATILFVGDIVGGLGRRTLLALLPELRERHAPTSSSSTARTPPAALGITPKIADELFAAGVDVITLGNHAYHRARSTPISTRSERIVRPGELPALASRATAAASSSATACASAS